MRQLSLFGESESKRDNKVEVRDIERILRDRQKDLTGCRGLVDSKVLKFVSYGAGRNSSALLVWMKANKIVPDAILFADTGGEKPETYEFLDIMDDWLARNDFPVITRLEASVKSKYSSLEEECLGSNTFPSKAYGYGKCSLKWKVQPQDKFRRNFKKQLSLQNSQHIEYQGIHYGEMRRLIGKDGRLKNLEDKNRRIEYPLITEKINDIGCLQLISAAGLPLPPKSACFFCPSSKPSEIIALKESHPDLYKRAIAIEHSGQLTVKSNSIKGLGRSFAWEDVGKLTPLEQLAIEHRALNKLCSCIDD